VDVRHLELDAGTIGGLAEPQEEISLFVLLEEHQVVATKIKAKISYNFLRFLAVDLGLLLGVGKQACEISDEMPHPAGDASRTHHQCSLPVLPLLSVRLLVLESPQCLPSVRSQLPLTGTRGLVSLISRERTDSSLILALSSSSSALAWSFLNADAILF
jgi:hypothetical protein